MKVDKAVLVKNLFWLLVPAAALCLLIAIFAVMGIYSSAETKLKAAQSIHGQVKQMLQDQSSIRTDEWIRKAREQTEQAVAQREELWHTAFTLQQDVVWEAPPHKPDPFAGSGGPAASALPRGRIKAIRNPLITWPVGPSGQQLGMMITVYPTPAPNIPKEDREWYYMPLQNRDFGEPFGIVPTEYAEWYPRQFEPILNRLPFLDEKVTDERKRGAVRALGNSTNHRENARVLLQPMNWNTNKPILDYEAWLAQEDVALKDELIRIIAAAIDAQAVLQPEWRPATVPEEVKPKPPQENPAEAFAPVPAEGAETKPTEPAKKTLDHKRFYNLSWYSLEPPKSDAAAEEKPPQKPVVRPPDWWQGWLLDLTLVTEGGKTLLRGTAYNYNITAAVPPSALQVFLEGVANPVVIKEAGDLPPSGFDKDKNVYTKVSERKFEVAVPANATRIVRVQRVKANPDWLDHQRFRSPSWLVDVRLFQPKGSATPVLEGTIHNISGQRQLPVRFEVIMTDGQQEIRQEFMTPQGEINAWTVRDFRQTVDKQVVRPQRIVGVRQVMDWRTVPVKRIDMIRVGGAANLTDTAHYHSDRTWRVKLQPYNFRRKDARVPEEEIDKPATPPPAAPGNFPGAGGIPPGPGDGGVLPPGPSDGTGPGLPPGPGGPGSGQARTALSENQLIPLERYTEVKRELRRIPVGMVLIVDANAINDVHTAFANSRLRIQVTQSVWRRHPPLGRPGGQPAAGGTPTVPGTSGTPPGPVVPPPGGGTAPATGGQVPGEDQTSLVKLEIYGYATIYENPEAIKRIEAFRKKLRESGTAIGGDQTATPMP
jgi:hypothetical protein